MRHFPPHGSQRVPTYEDFGLSYGPAGPSLQPAHEVVYGREGPRPPPLSSAPDLVENSYHEGSDQELLYVECEVGGSGLPMEMMVDTGAQMSVMSLSLVRRLGLTEHVNRSWQGVAAGVGAARILGRLRGIPVRLGSDCGVEFALDFSVLGVREEMLMLGVDQLRRFRVNIDLDRNCLVFGGRNGTEVALLEARPPSMIGVRFPFLSDFFR